MILKLKRTPGIYVVGFKGAGKSTVGRHLAHRLGWSFFDSDEEIEQAEKVAVSILFEERGEDEFRRIEAEIIRQHVRWIERGRPAVLALGGGAFAAPATRQLLENNGISVWLDCPFALVQQRVSLAAPYRTLARDPESFAALYHARRDDYGLADVHVAIESDDPEVTVNAILDHPVFK
jgi:shikimate kinase